MRGFGCSVGTRLRTGDEHQASQCAFSDCGSGRRGAGQARRLGGGVVGKAVTPAGIVTP